jgi:hypothetical protein
VIHKSNQAGEFNCRNRVAVEVISETVNRLISLPIGSVLPWKCLDDIKKK